MTGPGAPDADSSWVRRYQPADAAPARLVCLAHAGGSAGVSPPVARALEELAFFTTDVKILGVYPADPFRMDAG